MAPQPSIVVEADPARLGQVFSNLVNNACRYTANKGQIWVTIERTGTSAAVVTITDTGMGIPPEQLSSYLRDVLAGRSDRRARMAAWASACIWLNGSSRCTAAHVSAHSDGPGMGSRFTVRLPALPESVTLDEVATPVSAPYARTTCVSTRARCR